MINIFKKINDTGSENDTVDLNIDMLYAELELYTNNIKSVNMNYYLNYENNKLEYLNKEKEIIVNIGLGLLAVTSVLTTSVLLSVTTLFSIGIFQSIKYAFISRDGLNKNKYNNIEESTKKIKNLISSDKFKYLLIKKLEKEYKDKIKTIEDKDIKEEESKKINKLINELKISLIENDLNTVYKIIDVIYYIKSNVQLNKWFKINELNNKINDFDKNGFLKDLLEEEIDNMSFKNKEDKITKKIEIKKLL